MKQYWLVMRGYCSKSKLLWQTKIYKIPKIPKFTFGVNCFKICQIYNRLRKINMRRAKTIPQKSNYVVIRNTTNCYNTSSLRYNKTHEITLDICFKYTFGKIRFSSVLFINTFILFPLKL